MAGSGPWSDAHISQSGEGERAGAWEPRKRVGGPRGGARDGRAGPRRWPARREGRAQALEAEAGSPRGHCLSAARGGLRRLSSERESTRLRPELERREATPSDSWM